MLSGLNSMVGVLPVMMVGGLAMKISDRMFDQEPNPCPTPGRKIRSRGRGRGLARGRGRGPIGTPRRGSTGRISESVSGGVRRGMGVGVGNFSNLRP